MYVVLLNDSVSWFYKNTKKQKLLLTSCDTEDWSNDAEKSALALHFKIY